MVSALSLATGWLVLGGKVCINNIQRTTGNSCLACWHSRVDKHRLVYQRTENLAYIPYAGSKCIGKW